MDFNFGETRKQATAAADATKQAGHDLLGSFSADNAHTEKSFGVHQKEVDINPSDPQTFVQRMSAGAKEAQEELDAKFSKGASDVDNFLVQSTNNAKKGVASVTHDFMNAERGFMAGAGDTAKEIDKKAAQAVDEIFGHFGNGDGVNFMSSAPPVAPAPAANLIDDVSPFASFGNTTTAVHSKDSDTDSPSLSYNPSPAKKMPAAYALKEQDNEKFISSENLLGDFNADDRNATPDTHAFGKVSAPFTAPLSKPTQQYTTTDLDDDFDDDFVQAEIPKQPEPKAAPMVVSAAPTPVARPAPLIPEQVKNQPSVKEFKAADISTPIAAAAATTVVPPVVAKPAAVPRPTTSTSQHPNIVSVEDIFYKYGLDAWFKPERLHPRVESLIYWRDVKKSGIVFGAGLVTLLAISCFSVISVFAYLSLILLTGSIAFRIYKSVMQAIQKTSDGHPFKEYLEIDLTLSQEKIQNIAGVAVAHLNGFTAELRRLFLVEDLVDSIKFGVMLWVMTYIGAWFNGMTLVILAFVSLFTLPKVYENNKQSIDTYLDLARSKAAEVTEKIKLAIPIGNKKPVAEETDKDK